MEEDLAQYLSSTLQLELPEHIAGDAQLKLNRETIALLESTPQFRDIWEVVRRYVRPRGEVEAVREAVNSAIEHAPTTIGARDGVYSRYLNARRAHEKATKTLNTASSHLSISLSTLPSAPQQVGVSPHASLAQAHSIHAQVEGLLERAKVFQQHLRALVERAQVHVGAEKTLEVVRQGDAQELAAILPRETKNVLKALNYVSKAATQKLQGRQNNEESEVELETKLRNMVTEARKEVIRLRRQVHGDRAKATEMIEKVRALQTTLSEDEQAKRKVYALRVAREELLSLISALLPPEDGVDVDMEDASAVDELNNHEARQLIEGRIVYAQKMVNAYMHLRRNLTSASSSLSTSRDPFTIPATTIHVPPSYLPVQTSPPPISDPDPSWQTHHSLSLRAHTSTRLTTSPQTLTSTLHHRALESALLHRYETPIPHIQDAEADELAKAWEDAAESRRREVLGEVSERARAVEGIVERGRERVRQVQRAGEEVRGVGGLGKGLVT
ncbi:hypothetical protein SAICODRAFT_7540 [Saitoella complicata NRRL Y-17804]|nr:uncharacterized protein SAICODRAFT_7540 [Saitoella complicata NRRL Y-17804]ODQ52938.1 hypothetical protein SAICODRAFT_7540 [Saitoella complicata NRRL Y-17804]